MSIFSLLRKALGTATKAVDVAEKVIPAVAVVEAVADEVGKAVKPKKTKKKDAK